MVPWYKRCYARLLIDNHITEHDPSFMTRFDPERYVAMVKRAGIEASMVYATCHNGNCYYPSRVGHMHANLHGRDIFGETVGLLRLSGIVPIAYYTSIFHNHAAQEHPAWRITDARGEQHDGRYWWSCPSNPEYRRFVQAQIAEVISYDVDGIFNDMTFWPRLCVCPSCRQRYLEETGREVPTRVDWRDPAWVGFQRFRERTLASFAQEITDSIKARKDITVTHQTSTILSGWLLGYSLGIARACDYTSGDFYGGKYQHILGVKVLAGASRNQPAEFMTSRCVNLNDHTSMKSEAEMTAEAATTVASGGAPFFIDAINPDGTLEEAVYDRLSAVTRRLAPFTARLKEHAPVPAAETALYYSSPAYADEDRPGGIDNPPVQNPGAEELTGTAVALARAHIPFRVITPETADLGGLRTIVMNGVAWTAEEEHERLRAFVREGGTLIATGLTSLYRPDGSTTGDFGLADLFGVSYAGKRARRFHYLSLDGGKRLIASHDSAPLVESRGAEVIGLVTEPMFDPDDSRYASIHSNPPGVATRFAGLTVHSFGKGRCIYLSSPVLSLQQDAQQGFCAWLFATYAPAPMVRETNAPAAVEITVLRSTARNAYLVGFVNYQRELPNIPVRDLYAVLKLPGVGLPGPCTRVSDGARLITGPSWDTLRVEVPLLETIEMIEVGF